MKAHYTTQAGSLTFELEGESAKALFEQIAAVSEVFDAATKCGCCQKPYLRFVHRVVDDFHYYELRCMSCRARLQYGQQKKGGALFAKRRDDDGNDLPNYGWSKWEPQANGAKK